MARVVIYLRDTEVNALQLLAQQEYRAPKAQAALIIRKELERLGMVCADTNEGKEQKSLPAGDHRASKEDALHGTSGS